MSKSHQPSGHRWFRGFSFLFQHSPSLTFLREGFTPPYIPSPWTQHGGAEVRKPISFPLVTDFCCHSFFDTFLVPPFFRHLALLEPTCPILVSNLPSKTEPKSMIFGVQETTYVARRKNVKICTTLKRKPCFCFPRTPKKPPKIYQKSNLRASYVEVFF